VASSLTVSVLGPLRVDVDARPVALGRRARALMAALVIRRGQVVASDLLVEVVWPDGAPSDGRNALQALVSRARRALGPAGAALVTAGEGYLLDLPPEAVDAERFELAVVEARRSASGRDEPSDAGAVLGELLGAWRGDAYLDAAEDPAAVAAASRLSELRREAIDLRAEAVLRAGGGAELAADLHGVAVEAPLRERTHRALAHALYRTGRQADALDVLGGLRDRLRDELGLDPAPETDELYAAMLRRDAGLDPPAVAAAEQTGTTRSSCRARVGRLPVARTSFVGRGEDIAALRAGLRQARVVTLVGPGGTGKTRLAIEALRDLVPAPPDGTVLVELAPLTDPEDVLQHVAAALGIDPEPGGTPVGAVPTAARAASRVRPLAERVADHVADAELVLLLDNCEHLIEAAADLVELLLDAGPGVRIVATSREALRVPGERLQAVGPLPVPPALRPGPALDDADVATLAAQDAVALFVARAGAADPTFRLEATTAPAVVEIVRRSDGLPLALELAAARVATLPVTELATRLEDRFRLLTGGRRTVRRQQTLEAVVAWSYDLLDERQRWLLRRLGVSAGPVAVDLVEALVAAEGRPALRSGDVLPVLVELADRSLLTLEPVTVGGEDGQPASITTVRLLETIRAFAQERLIQEDDPAAVRTAHAEVLAARARAAGVAIRGRDQLRWLDQLDRDLEELRGALTWWLRTDPSRAVEMGADLGWYWWLHDHHDEGIRWLGDALERAGDVADPAAAAVAAGLLGLLQLTDNRIEAAARTSVWARATLARAPDPPPFASVAAPLLCAYVDALSGSDPHGALAEIQATVERADALGEDWVSAAGWFVLLGVLTSLGDHEGGWAAADRALQAAARSGDRWADFQTRSLLASDLAKVGRYRDAAHHLARALPLAEAIGARIHVRGIRVQQACVQMLAGDVEGAEQQLRALLTHGPTTDGEMAEALVNHALGMTSRRRGEVPGAIAAYRRAAEGFDASQEAIGAAEALAGLTHAEVARGDLEAAAAALRSALERAAGHPDELSLASTVPLLHEAAADLACARGDHEVALRHLGRAATLRDAVAGGLVAGERFDVDRIEAAARAGVSVSIAATAWAEGAETTGLLAPID
jgi:predicted ATPase/DNA-binding SARP family transcriptional activator/tetratricopeptide (TPR) repeat protein